MAVTIYTIQELESFLARSDLPSLISEGRDDYTLMRDFANRIGGDCLPVGGKRNVLQAALSPAISSRARTALLVDRDLWLFEGVPADFDGKPIVITDGYSIENDTLRDLNVESLLDYDEVKRYNDDIEQVCRWFASGVTARLTGMAFDFDRKISSILSPDSSVFSDQSLQEIARHPPGTEILRMILADHKMLLRGKTWLGIIGRHLCANGRSVQHPPITLLTLGLRSGGQFSSSLLQKVRDLLEQD